MKHIKFMFTAVIVLLIIFITLGCGKNEAQSKTDSIKQQENTAQVDSTKDKQKPKVTFIELGSVNCIPCKMMQPVMKTIEEEFGSQIEVVFYDVWKDPAPARKYGIRVIPTQVFLEESGKEFFRHQGFFPKADIEKLLVEKGLKMLKQIEIEN